MSRSTGTRNKCRSLTDRRDPKTRRKHGEMRSPGGQRRCREPELSVERLFLGRGSPHRRPIVIAISIKIRGLSNASSVTLSGRFHSLPADLRYCHSPDGVHCSRTSAEATLKLAARSCTHTGHKRSNARTSKEMRSRRARERL